MSWNHTQEYETAGFQDYASRLGGGQYEKVWDLGELLSSISLICNAVMPNFNDTHCAVRLYTSTEVSGPSTCCLELHSRSLLTGGQQLGIHRAEHADKWSNA